MGVVPIAQAVPAIGPKLLVMLVATLLLAENLPARPWNPNHRIAESQGPTEAVPLLGF